MDGQGELFVEEFGELAGFFGGGAIGAAEAEGETDDDFADLVFFEELFEEREVGALVFAEQSRQALGGYTERIGDGEADAAGAEIEGEDAAMRFDGSIFESGHSRIILADAAAARKIRHGKRSSRDRSAGGQQYP